MSESKLNPVPASMRDAHIDPASYQRLYQESIDDPDGFWSRMAREHLHWFSDDWQTVCKADMPKGQISWFEGGTLNASYNCLDRHLDTRGDQTAIIWEGDDPAASKHITYREAHAEVCRLANVLKDRGVNKGDRVCIYMPMIPEAAYAMLACARIGAMH
ncbi:MAG: AMP-binding protein, partial [Gammaproteobacteria bacterium]|nr:AMP-binding protein [Gammaproteobacteria bacterium]